MTVGVVIPCRNEQWGLPGVLEALRVQTRRPDRIVVVDDGSTDETARIARQWVEQSGGGLAVIDGPGRGVAAAVAAGVQALDTDVDVIVRLDGHCRPAPDYIERLAALVASPDVGVAGGVWIIEAATSSLAAEAIAVAMAHPLGSGGAAYRRATLDGVTDVDTVPFGCFRRSTWTELSGLDESLLTNEDYEFNYRVRQRGLGVVLDPAARCAYYARASLGELASQYGRYGWWKARMLARYPGAVRTRQVLPAMLVPGLAVVAAVAVGAGPAWLIALAVYPVAILLGALQAAIARRRPALVGWLAGALFTMHLAWSVAFWASLATLAVAGGSRRA